MKVHVVLFEIATDMEMAINHRARPKPPVPSLGEPRAAPRRKARNTRQYGVRAFERIVVDENGPAIGRQRFEPRGGQCHTGRAPGGPVRIGRGTEQQFVPTYDFLGRGPCDHVGGGDVVRPETVIVKQEHRRDHELRTIGGRPDRIRIFRRYDAERRATATMARYLASPRSALAEPLSSVVVHNS